MKKFLFSVLVIPFFLCGEIFSAKDHLPFPLYKETEHFHLFCANEVPVTADDLLSNLEGHFAKLSKDFQYECEGKIPFIVYPNIEAFHDYIQNPKAPNWMVTCFEGNSIFSVSPKNPGPIHTYQSILRCGMVSLTKFFLKEKYTGFVPNWLWEGVAFYESHLYSMFYDRSWLFGNEKAGSLPSLDQLERDKIKMENVYLYNRCSYSLVDFIMEKWGRDKVIALLEDYSSFEKILGVSKEELMDQWSIFLDNKRFPPH
ncbi:MAG: hypothetical protein WCP39_02595 [Chlamydiota bacterium]